MPWISAGPGLSSKIHRNHWDFGGFRGVDGVAADGPATTDSWTRLQNGFLYLVAILDLCSSHVLSLKLSISLDTEFCLDALEMALEGGRRPEIIHSDQGCQFTSTGFVARLLTAAIQISWSGR